MKTVCPNRKVKKKKKRINKYNRRFAIDNKWTEV